MNKVLLSLLFLIIQHTMFSQAFDFNTIYRSAIEMYSKGNYQGAKVRFAVALRKADKEFNYAGKQQCLDYIDKSDECSQLIKDGERTFSLGEFDIAKKYFDRLAELNPKDPNNIDRARKCRDEADYISMKKQADAFFLNKDWNQAYTLYSSCLDSSKKDLTSFKRFENEVERRNQECLRQMNIFNPDSIKLKLKNMKDKLFKKDKKKTGWILPKESQEKKYEFVFEEDAVLPENNKWINRSRSWKAA